MNSQFQQVEEFINAPDKSSPEVSSKSIYWHIDHLLKVITGICYMLKKSDPDDYQWEFNLSRLYIFTIGSIPRGKGRAPKAVMATEKVEKEELEKLLTEARQAWSEIDQCS